MNRPASPLSKVSLACVVVVLSLVTLACSSGDSEGSSRPDVKDETTTIKAPVEAVRPEDVPPKPSPGCRSTMAPPQLGSNEKLTLSVAGEERWYLQHAPMSYKADKPLPLILDLHGYSEGAEVHAALSALADVSESVGFLTITPQGQGSPPHWDTTTGSPDIKFVGALMDTASDQLCVDLSRVYVAGFSNGAFLASAAACAYSDRIAAIAPVAGLREVDGCDLKRAVPVITFHGDADTFVSFDGGFGPGVSSLPLPDGSGRTVGDAIDDGDNGPEADQLKEAVGDGASVPEIVSWWAKIDGCTADTKDSTIAPDVTLIAHECPPGVEVELYRIAGGGHSWPGSGLSAAIESVVGRTTTSIDANALIWEFFQQHPMGV